MWYIVWGSFSGWLTTNLLCMHQVNWSGVAVKGATVPMDQGLVCTKDVVSVQI